ncbi:spore cortex biosynthesis protein YabQ [Paenibacillus tarimensis]|uniref:spore cortex biosynthesis protein YabQ n=1 Tax=Paenibacillus tarimensis TaxID=416012 RepID=UPI001F3C7E45|nr:spore cortex biosynthesis protein YabQ [Paenibacillus tarimensis]MCF2946203.1 spore cortex biosynthesis protein YabQ [Paenibacillus tarimensis]
MNLEIQFLSLAVMMLSGVGMGAAFDGYRVVSNQLRIGRIWVPVLDLLYWTAATLIVFRMLIASNDGEVRFYVFLGLFIGISFYFWLLSRIIIRIVEWLMDALRSLWAAAVRAFEVLFIKPVILVYRLLKITAGFLIVCTMFLFRIVVQLLRPFWLFLSWILSPLIRPLWGWMKQTGEKLGLPGLVARIKAFFERIRNHKS